MIYFIAGKREAVDIYIAEHPLKSGEKIKYCTSPENLASIYDWDKVILLPGWWKKEWAIQPLKFIQKDYPRVEIIFEDGPFGLEYRDKLIEDRPISNKFTLMDFEE